MIWTVRRPALDALFAIALLAIAIGHVFWLLSLTDKGFDFTDEATNTLLAMFPDRQFALVTLAGYLNSFLWNLSGQSVPFFRLLGMGILLGCVLSTTACAITYARKAGLRCGTSALVSLMAAAMGSVLFFYRELHEVTPSYNWLVMIGLLIVQSGFFLLLSGHSNLRAAITMGIGGFIAFAGKPTSGIAILALLTLIFLLMEERRKCLRVTGGALLVAAALGVSCAVWLVGGLAETREKFAFGLEYLRLGQTHHTPHEMLGALANSLLMAPWKVFLWTQKYTIAAIIALAFLAKRFPRHSRYGMAGILFLSVVELSTHDISHGNFIFYVVSSFALSLLAGTISLWAVQPKRSRDVAFRTVLFPLLLGIAVAISFVFGTNTGPGGKLLLPTVSIVLPLLLVGLWAEQCVSQRGVVLTIAFTAVFSGAVLLHRGASHPFRNEGGMSAQTERVTFFGQSAPISLDPAKAAYVRAILKAAATSGWVAGTPVLSLTGYTPGVNVILDAPFVGVAWVTARSEAYQGGQEAFEFLVANTSEEERSKAWIFTSSNGDRRLDPGILERDGYAFPCGYRLVGEFKTYEKVETIGDPVEIHQLWRPSEANESCGKVTLTQAGSRT